MANPARIFENFKNAVLTKFGANPGQMLIYTGVLGWFISSLAQVVAIAFNDKIPKEQKAFLIPQEIGDGAINVISFFLVTNSLKTVASKLVSTGKLTTPAIKEFLQKNNINSKDQLGNINFDIAKLPNFGEIKDKYIPFKNGVDVAAMTVGSVLSCNIITPILRNKFAAKRQRVLLSKQPQNAILYPKGISMDEYIRNVSMKYSSNKLRI